MAAPDYSIGFTREEVEESQRNVNADVTNKLIAYMDGDHAKMIVVTEKVLLVMDKVLERLDRRPLA